MKCKRILSWMLALIMLMGLFATAVSAAAPASVLLTANGNAPSITIDGTVNEAEWGAPIGSWTKEQVAATTGWSAWGSAPDRANKKAELYVRRDAENLYLAVKLINAWGRETGLTASTASGDTWKYAGLYVMLGAYNAETNINTGVHAGKSYDKHYQYRLQEKYDPATSQWTDSATVRGAGLDNYPTLKNYVIGWDDSSNTYTYEMAIPFSDIAGHIKSTDDLALALRITDMKQPDAKDGAGNQWQISKASNSLYWNSSNPDQFKNNNPLHISFTNVLLVANGTTPSITVDGTVTASEWGASIGSWTSETVDAAWGGDATWLDGVDKEGKKVELYARRDSENLYLAFRMVNAQKRENGYTASTAAGDAWKYASLSFTMGAYSADSNIVYGTHQGSPYMKYLKYTMREQYDAQAGTYTDIVTVDGKGADSYYKPVNYIVGWDEASSTYTYEMAIPFEKISTHITAKDDIALAFTITDAKLDSQQGGNQWHISRAHQKTNFKDNKPLHVNFVGEISKNVLLQARGDVPVITVDGKVDQAEWGDPIGKWTHDQVNATAFWDIWSPGPQFADADGKEVELYARRDADKLYLAFRMINAQKRETGYTASTTAQDAWKYAGLEFAMGTYNEEVNIVNGTHSGAAYERWIRYTLREQYDSQTNSYTDVHTVTGKGSDRYPALKEYLIDWDEATKTYTYEMAISLNSLSGYIDGFSDIVLSFTMTDAQMDTTSGGNQWQISTANKNANNSTVAFRDKNPIRITFTGHNLYYIESVKETAPIMDASISEDEWGTPIIVTSPSHAVASWGEDGFWSKEDFDGKEDQLARVYMMKDSNYIYMGVTLDHAAPANNAGTEFKYSPQISFSLSEWDDENTVKHITVNDQEYEDFSHFRLGWEDGTPVCLNKSSYNNGQQPDRASLTADDWRIMYDEASQTYIYEVRIPYSATNINPDEAIDIALSLQIGDGMHNVSSIENNRYNIGGTGAANAYDAAQAEKYPHKGQALKLSLRERYYVSNRVSDKIGDITIDGSINAQEWGNPIIVTNPAHTKQEWNGYWNHDPAAYDLDQTVRIYATNDGENLYFACTIDHTDYDDPDGKASYAKAHFMLSVGRYDEQTGMERVTSVKETYERFNIYRMYFNNNNKLVLNASGNKVANVTASACDYAAKYDAETRTYTYELCIPISQTTLRFGNQDQMAVCFTVAPANTEKDANRYNVGGTGTAFGSTKAGNFAHTGQCLQMKLNANNYTGAPQINYDNVMLETNPKTGDISIIIWVSVFIVATVGMIIIFPMSRKQMKHRG